MGLEGISKEECIIKEAFNNWTNERSDKYTEKHEIEMNVKMYISLTQLYMKRKNHLSSLK